MVVILLTYFGIVLSSGFVMHGKLTDKVFIPEMAWCHDDGHAAITVGKRKLSQQATVTMGSLPRISIIIIQR